MGASSAGGEGKKMGEWQLIETAPKDGRSILGFGEWGCAVVYWSADQYIHDWELSVGEIVGGTTEPRYVPTHWMPLPEPPNTELQGLPE